jgi:hypothetical protein
MPLKNPIHTVTKARTIKGKTNINISLRECLAFNGIAKSWNKIAIQMN